MNCRDAFLGGRFYELKTSIVLYRDSSNIRRATTEISKGEFSKERRLGLQACMIGARLPGENLALRREHNVVTNVDAYEASPKRSYNLFVLTSFTECVLSGSSAWPLCGGDTLRLKLSLFHF